MIKTYPGCTDANEMWSTQCQSCVKIICSNSFLSSLTIGMISLPPSTAKLPFFRKQYWISISKRAVLSSIGTVLCTDSLQRKSSPERKMINFIVSGYWNMNKNKLARRRVACLGGEWGKNTPNSSAATAITTLTFRCLSSSPPPGVYNYFTCFYVVW